MSSILITISSLNGGGAERVATNLANSWAAANHQVTIVTWSPASAQDYSLLPIVEHISHRLDQPSNSLNSSIRNNFKRFLEMRKSILKCKPDIIVSLMTSMNVTVALSNIGLPAHTVLCEHSYPPNSTSSRFWTIARKYTYRFADIVVALTSEGEQWLLNHTHARNVITLANALVWPPPKKEPFIDKNNFLLSNRKYIFNAASLADRKNHARLIKSFARLAKQYPDWDLVIAGDGPLKNEINHLCKTLKLDGRVIMPGAVGNIQDWYQATHIYALSSNHEGFPLSLLEAMASGMAVVSVNCQTGPAEIINHEFDGLLVDVNTDALANGLERIMMNSELHNRLSGNAVQVINRYSEIKIMDRWQKLFSTL